MNKKGDNTKKDIIEKAYQLFSEKNTKMLLYKIFAGKPELSRGGLYRHQESTGLDILPPVDGSASL